MKKIIIFLAVLAALIAPDSVFAGGGRERLNLYNWSYYTPDSVIRQFEKEFNARVTIDEFASNEEMYAKLRSGGSGYDIVFPTQDYVSIMMNQGMLERIDRSLVPNLRNIDPAALRKAAYDPNMDYAVPYYWGVSGIIVNTARVPNYEESWSIFGRSDLRGRMTMLDDMREVIGAALLHLGFSLNSRNQAEITAARDLINNQWKPNLTKFDAEAYGKGYANGEFWVVQCYPEAVYEEILENEELLRNTRFFIPPQGGTAYIDSMVILKGARNVELAHKFIDFIHRPEIYAEFCDAFGFPSTVNVPARRFVQGPSWYQAEDVVTGELKYDLGEALEMYNDAWFNSIRVGN